MLRIYRVTGGLVAVFAVWLAAFRSSVPPAQHLAISVVRRLSRFEAPKKYVHQNAEAYRSYGLQTPFFLVLLFGIYSVTALAYGVITFRTVPEEAVALRQVHSLGVWHLPFLLASIP